MEGENLGFKHILLQPHFVPNLDWVRASHRSPYGVIMSSLQRNDITGTVTLTFRYDDVADDEAGYTDMSLLRIKKYVGGEWTDITGSINTTDKTITTEAGLTSLRLV